MKPNKLDTLQEDIDNTKKALETLLYWLVQTADGTLRLDEADKLVSIMNGRKV